MRNPPAAYKHDDPTHQQFNQSADSSLLAKRSNQRPGYAYGGPVIPTQTLKNLLDNKPANAYVNEKGAFAYTGGNTSMEDARAAQNWAAAVTHERENPTADPMGGGADVMGMLDKVSAGTNNPSIAGTKALAAQFAQQQGPTLSRYPQGYDPYGNGGWAQGGPGGGGGPVIDPNARNTSGIASGQNVAMPYHWPGA